MTAGRPGCVHVPARLAEWRNGSRSDRHRLASGFGALHELNIDDLDDLRLVVDELCGFFIDLGTTQPINIELRPREGAGIEILARAPAPPNDGGGHVDELRQQVMEALTEQLRVDLGTEQTEVHATVVPGS